MGQLERFLFKYPFLLKEIVLRYPNEKKNFMRRLGYELNLSNPVSLNEKIVWKKIHDRNPLLPIVADKIRVRDFVRVVLGEDYNKILIPLYCVAKDPFNIDFDRLPKEYIVKANHGSGMNVIVDSNNLVPKEEILRLCRKWLREDYGRLGLEWAYTVIPRRILVEQLVRNENGTLADDYKFHIINGKFEFVHINHDKFFDHSPSLYDNNWNKFPVSYKGKVGPDINRPKKLEQMIFIAESLGRYFDYIRVDLYLCNDRIYIGELTNYPASGSAKYSPVSFDFQMGSKWKLLKNYWRTNGSVDVFNKVTDVL